MSARERLPTRLFEFERHDIWRPVRKPSKSPICSKLRAKLASLRAAVAALQTPNRRKSAPPIADEAGRESAKKKRFRRPTKLRIPAIDGLPNKDRILEMFGGAP
jgi:hypothetical protein